MKAKEIEYEMTEEEYRDLLDELYGDVEICGMKFSSGYALQQLDETAFRCGKSDYESQQPSTWECGECGETFDDEDGAEENEIYEINQQRERQGKESISWDDVKWSYEEYKTAVIEGVTRRIGADLKKMGFVEAVTFQELRSPREYNFSNDSINVAMELTKKNVIKIGGYLKENKSAFEEYIKDRYTSRSGFFSNYTNDVYGWLGNLGATLAHGHMLGSVLNFILLNENGEDYEQSICESLSGNGVYLYAENFDELAGERQ